MDRYRFRKLLWQSLLGGHLLNFYRKRRRFFTDKIEGNDLTFNLDTEIGLRLYFEGGFEKKEIELCRKYIREESVVLDIGANVGIHSAYFSQIAIRGLVFSFEPSPETFAILSKNVGRIENIIPVNIGLSDSKKVADFYVASDDAYSSLKDTKRKEIKRKVKVVCLTVDDFFEGLNLNNIDFVKIDVEGLEQSVLEGMRRLIERHKPVIFCEIYKGTGSNEDPERTVKYLIDKGYKAFVFDGERLIDFKRHDDRFYNYFFLPRAEK